jgi:hypothetical protein
MNEAHNPIAVRRSAALAALVLSGSMTALAEDPSPLQIYQDDKALLKATFMLQTAGFRDIHSWWGKAEQNIGGSGNDWFELGVQPGLEGQLELGPESGTLFGRASGIFTLTAGGLDAAGSNFDPRTPNDATIGQAFLGWRSGDAVSFLGPDAIQLSFGSQDYEVGSGFLFGDGATDGGPRGGFWLGMRRAFALAGIARLETHGLKAEFVWLRPDDVPNTSTYLYGTNWEYALGEDGRLGTVGAGFWKIDRSQVTRREGLSIYDVRADLSPLAGGAVLPGLRIAGELAYEYNPGRVNAGAWYGEAGYAFESLPGQPYASYRFAFFSGPGRTSPERRFDPLFYGSSDWGTWYVGEILGNFVVTNSNLEFHTLRLRFAPRDDLTLHLLAHYAQLDRLPSEIASRVSARAASVTSRRGAEELDLVAEWAATGWLSVSGVVGAAFPNRAAQEFTGGAVTWVHFMLFSQIAF